MLVWPSSNPARACTRCPHCAAAGWVWPRAAPVHSKYPNWLQTFPQSYISSLTFSTVLLAPQTGASVYSLTFQAQHLALEMLRAGPASALPTGAEQGPPCARDRRRQGRGSRIPLLLQQLSSIGVRSTMHLALVNILFIPTLTK